MATKTVKDEKTADVPAEKNSAKVKTSSVSRYTVDELSKAENEFNYSYSAFKGRQGFIYFGRS